MTTINNTIDMIRQVKGMLNDSQDEVFLKLSRIEDDLMALDGYCYWCYETKQINQAGRCPECQDRRDQMMYEELSNDLADEYNIKEEYQ